MYFFIINLLIILNVIFRFLALKITKLLLINGEYDEVNPISRKLLKHPKLLYGYNIFWFILTFIGFNMILILEPTWSNIMLIVSILYFLLVFFADFFNDLICYRNYKRGLHK